MFVNMMMMMLLVLLCGEPTTTPALVLERVAAAAPPRVRTLSITTRASASVLWVVGTFRVQSADSLITQLRTPTDTATHRWRSTVTRDSFALTITAPGDTMRGTFAVRAKRTSPAATSGWASAGWTYVVPWPPPTIQLDSIWTRPDTITVSAGSAVPFCAFFWSGGKVARKGATVPGCVEMYERIPLALRSPIPPAFQALADTTCITWAAPDGGVLTVRSGCVADAVWTAPPEG